MIVQGQESLVPAYGMTAYRAQGLSIVTVNYMQAFLTSTYSTISQIPFTVLTERR